MYSLFRDLAIIILSAKFFGLVARKCCLLYTSQPVMEQHSRISTTLVTVIKRL